MNSFSSLTESLVEKNKKKIKILNWASQGICVDIFSEKKERKRRKFKKGERSLQKSKAVFFSVLRNTIIFIVILIITL